MQPTAKFFFAAMLCAGVIAVPAHAQTQQTQTKPPPEASRPISIPVLPLQPNLPGAILPGMPGIPNAGAATQALGQNGLPANNLPRSSLSSAAHLPGAQLTCPALHSGAALNGGAVYGAQYGENLGAGPGSINDQASAVLGTACAPR